MDDMPAVPPDLRVFAKGFWLPIGRSNFFDSQRDKVLIADCNGYSEQPGRRLTGYDAVAQMVDPKRLNSSVYRRLITVLPSALRLHGSDERPAAARLRYSRAFPMYNGEALDDITEDTDPDTIALICDDLRASDWDGVREYLESVTLVIVSEGIYVWLALYHEGTDAQAARDQLSALDHALDAHIYELVGGSFFNRSSGRPDVPTFVQDPNTPTLKDYRDHNLGMLSYFQINLIFEGLFSAALDPRVFFDNGADRDEVDQVKQSYSLGNFAHLITADVRFELKPGQTTNQLTADLWTFTHLPDTWLPQQYFDLFKQVRENATNPFVRRDVLRRYLSKTSTETVHLLKLRTESCGRELLELLIKSAHLRRPLVQTDAPPTTNVLNPAQDRYLVRPGVNEGQLRGYIMLLAAKLPLVQDAQHYLENTLRRLDELTKELPEPTRPHIERAIAGLKSARVALLEAIKEDIEGLERALEQAYMDNMVIETEKLRSEQETAADLQRIRERDEAELPDAAGLTANVTAGVLSLVTVLLTIFFAAPNFALIGRAIAQLLKAGTFADVIGILVVSGGALILLVLLFALYSVGLAVLGQVASRVFRLRWGGHRAEQNYYEMDLRLDATMDSLSQSQRMERILPDLLLRERFDQMVIDPPWAAALPSERARFPVADWGKKWAPRRRSYRVNRTGADQALHKVYVVAYVYWPAGPKPALTPPHRRQLRLDLVYEVLFHIPSEEPTYLLHTFRVVATSQRILSREQLDGLKRLVIWQFVNPWITDAQQRIKLDKDTDAVFSLSTSADLIRPERHERQRARVASLR